MNIRRAAILFTCASAITYGVIKLDNKRTDVKESVEQLRAKNSLDSASFDRSIIETEKKMIKDDSIFKALKMQALINEGASKVTKVARP